MAFVNLFPLGIVQLYYAVDIGYWYARSLAFINLPWVNVLEWARLPGTRCLLYYRRDFTSDLALLAGSALSKPAPG
jgi:hypothetical protein